MLWTFLFVILLNSLHSSPAGNHLAVLHLGPCNGDQDEELPIKMSEITINRHRNDSHFSGQLNVTQDLENGWKIKTTLKKCQDIRNSDTCDYFNSYYLVENGCDEDDEARQELYEKLFRYITPEIQCPIKAGVYHIDEYPYFSEHNYVTATETKISTSVYGYLCILEGYSQNEDRIFCAEAVLQLLYVRDHDWLKYENRTITVTDTHDKSLIE